MTMIANMIRSLGKWFCRLEEALLCVLLLAMILLACLQILMRGLFSTGFLWSDPLLRFMVIWAGLFGAAVATRQEKHIAIDLVSYLLPDRAKPWLNFLTNLFSMAVSAVLAYAAIVFIRNEAAFNNSSDLLGLPSWMLNLAFPAAFTLIALRFLILAAAKVLKIARQLRGRTAASS